MCVIAKSTVVGKSLGGGTGLSWTLVRNEDAPGPDLDVKPLEMCFWGLVLQFSHFQVSWW